MLHCQYMQRVMRNVHLSKIQISLSLSFFFFYIFFTNIVLQPWNKSCLHEGYNDLTTYVFYITGAIVVDKIT